MRSSSDGSSLRVAMMLPLRVSTCTAAHPQSAVTPPVPGNSDGTAPQARRQESGVLPRADHIVVVIFENEHRSSVIEARRRRTSTSWQRRGPT